MAASGVATVALLLRLLLLEVVPGVAKRCVFLHGIGGEVVSPPTPNDTEGSWGGKRIEQSTPLCSERAFVHQDTTSQGWDNEVLQKAYCEAAVGQEEDGVIRDTIVYTHSMGNLILAGALYNKTCSFGNSSEWYSLNAPWFGSKAGKWVKRICQNISAWETPVQYMATAMHFCKQDKTEVNDAYLSVEENYPKIPLLWPMLERVDGALCGDSPFGITSVYSVGFEVLSMEIGYGEWNDGIVGLDSCLLPGRTYGEKYKDKFYVAQVNHIDGLCREGDGYGNSRKPCSWIAARSGAAVVGVLEPPLVPDPPPTPRLPMPPGVPEVFAKLAKNSTVAYV